MTFFIIPPQIKGLVLVIIFISERNDIVGLQNRLPLACRKVKRNDSLVSFINMKSVVSGTAESEYQL